jgi:hypothetical protein
VLRYIAGSVDYGLDYIRGDGVSLIGYTDSDWAGCATDRKSTSRCCFGLGSGLVSWYSRKQKSVALSSAEAEYMAASRGQLRHFPRKLSSGVPREVVPLWLWVSNHKGDIFDPLCLILYVQFHFDILSKE